MYQENPFIGPSKSGLYLLTVLESTFQSGYCFTKLCHCSLDTSLVAMAKRRGMRTRWGVSSGSRSGSVGGDPMTNSTEPSITAKVCPWEFMNQRRSSHSLSFVNSASATLSLSFWFHLLK